MLIYILIGLCLTLAGVAGLQMTYMIYLDRLDKDRKDRLRELEIRCLKLSTRLEHAESRMVAQDKIIEELYSEASGDETWAEVLDEA